MSILSKIIHPVKSLEKWALTKLLEGFIHNIPYAKEKVKDIWEQHKYEIFEKVKKAMQKAISDFIKKKVEEQGATLLVQSDN